MGLIHNHAGRPALLHAHALLCRPCRIFPLGTWLAGHPPCRTRAPPTVGSRLVPGVDAAHRPPRPAPHIRTAAAALQYGIERDFTNRTETVVLYDLGAASLQAALVTYSAYTNAKVRGTPWMRRMRTPVVGSRLTICNRCVKQLIQR